MVICHAMRTLHTCANGARAVANLRNRRDRGSIPRRADLKRWVDPPFQRHTRNKALFLGFKETCSGTSEKPLETEVCLNSIFTRMFGDNRC